jgi:YesN/AraC family two-component response regulator
MPKRKKAILCVDDDRLVLQSLKAQLSPSFQQDYIIETAETADEALEAIEFLAIRKIETVLMICDWLMPEMRGDDLLIAAYERFPNMATIMLSGQADETAIRKSFEKGNLTTFLAKPWKEDELLKQIKLLLPPLQK